MKYIIVIILSIITSSLIGQIQAPFKDGETLHYTIKYGFLLGGKGSLEVKNINIDNKNIIYTKAIGYTAGVFSIYKVLDIYESFIDPKTDLPIKAIRNIREGNYKRYDIATFNRTNNTVFSSRKNDTVRIAKNAFDILSCFYFARKHLLKPTNNLGDTISMDTYFAGKAFPVKILYRGMDTIKTKFGKIPCYKFVPLVEKGRVFESEENIEVYISSDENRIPIRVKFKILIGSLVCDLDSFKGLNNSFKVIIK